MDLYDVLGISPDATADQIKRAYRDRARTTHPDLEGGSKVAFQRLCDAYDVLRDSDRRKRYDETGDVGGKGPRDDPMARALSALSQYISRALNMFVQHGHAVDMLDLIRQSADEDRQKITMMLQGPQKTLVEIGRLRKRIKLKVDAVAPDRIALILAGMEDEVKEFIAKNQREIDALALVMKIIDDYEEGSDPSLPNWFIPTLGFAARSFGGG